VRVLTGPYVGFPWKLIGGHIAVDLVNTVAWRPNPHRVQERLLDAEHLADWLAVIASHYGLPADLAPADLIGTPRNRPLTRVRRLREATAAALDAAVRHRAVPTDALHIVDAAWRHALARADLAPHLPLRHTISVGNADQALEFLALEVGRFCSGDELRSLRRCDDSECGWYFLDTSRNHSRRWCDSGDCGNRARVRAFAERDRRRAR
jgi:predicted RNA-binding Zn ribbon-like protein